MTVEKDEENKGIRDSQVSYIITKIGDRVDKSVFRRVGVVG